MKSKAIRACIPAVVMMATMIALEGRAQKPMPGGYSAASVAQKEVIAAAAFAIKAKAEAMKEKNESPPAKLELVKIVSARQQVVAGLNIHLTMQVKLNGQEKAAEAVVWWQAWRSPDPYQLTSWDWK